MLSIITITKNNLAGLQKTARSVLSQTHSPAEWIVIDGASDDGSPDFLNTLDVSYLHFITEDDEGLYDAMNKGLTLAKSDYILFLNAGDILAEDHIVATLHKVFEHNRNPDFIYADSIENKSLKRARCRSNNLKTIQQSFTFGMITHHQSMIYKRSTIDPLRYDMSYKISADYKFTLQFLDHAKYCLYWPYPLCNFEQGGLSQQHTKLGRDEQYHIRQDLKIVHPVKNGFIYFMQNLALILRQFCAPLYWFLKRL